MSKATKGKFDDKGRKIRSIYSPGYHGTRVPTGKPGNQKPLLEGENLRELYRAAGYAVREQA